MAYMLQGTAGPGDNQAKADMGDGPKHRISAKRRKKTAVIHQGGKDKFPIPDKAHAKSALGRINQAKPPLTASQKAKVRARARAVLSKGA